MIHLLPTQSVLLIANIFNPYNAVFSGHFIIKPAMIVSSALSLIISTPLSSFLFVFMNYIVFCKALLSLRPQAPWCFSSLLYHNLCSLNINSQTLIRMSVSYEMFLEWNASTGVKLFFAKLYQLYASTSCEKISIFLLSLS